MSGIPLWTAAVRNATLPMMTRMLIMNPATPPPLQYLTERQQLHVCLLTCVIAMPTTRVQCHSFFLFYWVAFFLDIGQWRGRWVGFSPVADLHHVCFALLVRRSYGGGQGVEKVLYKRGRVDGRVRRVQEWCAAGHHLLPAALQSAVRRGSVLLFFFVFFLVCASSILSTLPTPACALQCIVRRRIVIYCVG